MTDNNSDSIGAMIELAARCEDATIEGSECILLTEAFHLIVKPADGALWPIAINRFHQLMLMNAFLEAAMTLVPEGRDGVLMNCGVEGFHVSNKHRQHIARLFAPFSGERAEGRSITNAALALCAAALRAVAQTKSEGSQ